ncbi:hypothetical protein C7P63_01935 [Vagococcus humatus]|uniref:WxL domain-containing protein n=2 Tax=Vagococcus humatus TaxID=1889241 RepID=A0A429Z857_9ENTE|nr:hypothetical protein C7P63_01935 [Vagococcus humatus]
MGKRGEKMKKKKFLLISVLLVGLSSFPLPQALAKEAAFWQDNLEEGWEYEDGATSQLKMSFKSVLDPTNPDQKVVPKDPDAVEVSSGYLTIDYVSNYRFGKHPVHKRADYYYPSYDIVSLGALTQQDLTSQGSHSLQLKMVPHFIQLTDDRRNSDNTPQKKGWKLCVLQEQVFESPTASLSDTSISLKNGHQATTSQDTQTIPTLENDISITFNQMEPVWKAEQGQGYGTWLAYFGKQATAEMQDIIKDKTSVPTDKLAYLNWLDESIPDNDSGVSMTIPKSEGLTDEGYETTFSWIIDASPNFEEPGL